MKCNQENCDKDATYLYTWPGQKEGTTCDQHRKALLEVANVMGFHLPMIPIVMVAP